MSALYLFLILYLSEVGFLVYLFNNYVDKKVNETSMKSTVLTKFVLGYQLLFIVLFLSNSFAYIDRFLTVDLFFDLLWIAAIVSGFVFAFRERHMHPLQGMLLLALSSIISYWVPMFLAL